MSFVRYRPKEDWSFSKLSLRLELASNLRKITYYVVINTSVWFRTVFLLKFSHDSGLWPLNALLLETWVIVSLFEI